MLQYTGILYENEELHEPYGTGEIFTDLNIGRIINEITKGMEQYGLDDIYRRKPVRLEDVKFRQAVMKDLEDAVLFEGILEFCRDISNVDKYLSISYELHLYQQNEKWLLDAAYLYCSAVERLVGIFDPRKINSEGLTRIYNWLKIYVSSKDFLTFTRETAACKEKMEAIRYCAVVDIAAEKVIICDDNNVNDYCGELARVFNMFRNSSFDDDIKAFSDVDMCFFESKVLDMLRDKNKSIFIKLNVYYEKYKNFFNSSVRLFEREVRFYITYMLYINKLKEKGYVFSYPVFMCERKIIIKDGYDLALADKLHTTGSEVVPNDFIKNENECGFILTGPNQGGKTTFARMLGQVLYFASLGLPAPCKHVEMFFIKGLYTHFPVEEDINTNSGRLKEELARLALITRSLKNNSIVLLNELFSTTTTHDAFIMGSQIIKLLAERDCICLYVTHIFELAGVDDNVSLIATVKSEAGNRTYKVIRSGSQNRAYASSLAEKHKLDYKSIMERKNEDFSAL